ncbi:hypothetical protein SARC_17606, partial [Sphaeroforma arctica JP610]
MPKSIAFFFTGSVSAYCIALQSFSPVNDDHGHAVGPTPISATTNPQKNWSKMNGTITVG